MKKEKFPNRRKPSHWWVCGEFLNLRGQHNWEETKHTHTHTHIMRLTTTPSGEVVQMLASSSSELGLNREVWADCLVLGPGPNAMRTI